MTHTHSHKSTLAHTKRTRTSFPLHLPLSPSHSPWQPPNALSYPQGNNKLLWLRSISFSLSVSAPFPTFPPFPPVFAFPLSTNERFRTTAVLPPLRERERERERRRERRRRERRRRERRRRESEWREREEREEEQEERVSGERERRRERESE